MGINVGRVKTIHIILEHGSLAQQIAHFCFVISEWGKAIQIAGIESVTKGIGIARLGTTVAVSR